MNFLVGIQTEHQQKLSKHCIMQNVIMFSNLSHESMKNL